MKHTDEGLSVLGLTMLALGTIVGGSFFLGSAIPIRASGPSVIIAYLLGGGLVYLILFALSEMTVSDPDPGSFRTFAQRAFGPYAGFVVGWVYWTGMVLAMSSEATAISIFLRTWFPNISLPITGSVIITLVVLVNLLGVDKLSKLENSLAAIKLLAIVIFIVVGIIIIFGFIPNTEPIGLGHLKGESIFSGGASALAGSMLIVMFTYAGFEIIGLAASETKDPHKNIPKAIFYTVISLISLYTIAILVLLPLIPSKDLSDDVSPMVAALELNGIGWAAKTMNVVLVTAILSTMLAAMFGIGRMLRSLAEEGYAPNWIKDKGDIPYRGIIFSGIAMLFAFASSFLLPEKVYVFLVSSGGFSLLFTYLVIVLTHNKFRKLKGCPPTGHCQLPLYPYTSWIATIALIVIIISMPLVPGQGSGLIAGISLVIFYLLCYLIFQRKKNKG